MPVFVNKGHVINKRGLRVRGRQVDRSKDLIRLEIGQDRIYDLEARTGLDLRLSHDVKQLRYCLAPLNGECTLLNRQIRVCSPLDHAIELLSRG